MRLRVAKKGNTKRKSTWKRACARLRRHFSRCARLGLRDRHFGYSYEPIESTKEPIR